MKSELIIGLCGEQGIKQQHSEAVRYDKKMKKDLVGAKELYFFARDFGLKDVPAYCKENPNIYDILGFHVTVWIHFPTYSIEVLCGWSPPEYSPNYDPFTHLSFLSVERARGNIQGRAEYSKNKETWVGAWVTEQDQFAIFLAFGKKILVEGVRGFGDEDTEPDFMKLAEIFNCLGRQDELRKIWNSSHSGTEVALAMEEILKIPLYIPNYDAYTLETDFPYHKIYVPKPETQEKFSFSCSVTVPQTREFDWTSNIAVLHFLKDSTDGALLEHLIADCREKHDYATMVEEEKYISWWNSSCITDNVYDYAIELTEKYHCKAFAVNAYDGLFISLGAFQNGQLATEAMWGEGQKRPNMAVLQEAFGVGPELAKVFRLRSFEKLAKQLPEAMQFYVDIPQGEMTVCVQDEDCLVLKPKD